MEFRERNWGKNSSIYYEFIGLIVNFKIISRHTFRGNCRLSVRHSALKSQSIKHNFMPSYFISNIQCDKINQSFIGRWCYFACQFNCLTVFLNSFFAFFSIYCAGLSALVVLHTIFLAVDLTSMVHETRMCMTYEIQ